MQPNLLQTTLRSRYDRPILLHLLEIEAFTDEAKKEVKKHLGKWKEEHDERMLAVPQSEESDN